MWLRQVVGKLWPREFSGRSTVSPVPGFDRSPSLVFVSLKVFFGASALVLAALGFFTLERCASDWQGSVRNQLLQELISVEVLDACHGFYRKDYSDFYALIETHMVGVVFPCALVFSIGPFAAEFCTCAGWSAVTVSRGPYG